MMKKLAIIGASYLQVPLIRKAKEMGLETHVFAWAAGDPGETIADHFYPISIIEKEQILEKCRQIGISGICSIASDLAMVTVNYVGNALGLPGNGAECTLLSTNKHAMREAFLKNGDPSPRSVMVDQASDPDLAELSYPLIVKPTDRSGSRGITRIEEASQLAPAIALAMEQSFEKRAVVEEFVTGTEYSVECISSGGKHHLLNVTRKFTTGVPHFIETGHMEPAFDLPVSVREVEKVIYHALDSLKVECGASHSEIRVTKTGRIRIIEIGARMGGDFIGSDLVQLSTGIDFVRAVIDTALGKEPDLTAGSHYGAAAVRFVFSREDVRCFDRLMEEHPEYVLSYEFDREAEGNVTDSASRHGYFLMAADTTQQLLPWMPEDENEAVEND